MEVDINLTNQPALAVSKKRSYKKVSSFDVFDTLLTRKVGEPTAVFLLLGNFLWKHNIIKCTPEVFAHARSRAEAMAQNKPNLPMVNLQQIYKELQYMLKLSPATRDKILALECQLESDLLTAVPGANLLVQKASQSGEKVVLISDMYLSSDFIDEQIVKNGFEIDQRCYVSNEYLKSKRTGELFKVVAKKHGLSPSDYTHYGDNKKSDYDAPKKLNWNAIHFKDSKINRYEHILNSYQYETGGLSSVMAGASRLARLSIQTRSSKEREISNISASVVGPVLVSFVLWVLTKAKEQGLKRLYFVARDGQIYLKIANILKEKLNLDIELHYLYGSRKAWHFPSVTNLEDELDWITRKVNKLSIRKVLERVSVKPEEIKDVLQQNGFPENTWEKDIKIENIEKIRMILLHNEVKDLILEKARTKREVLFEYFEQEGLIKDENWALIDIGWGGNSQNFMGKILKLYGAPLPKGFYFALKSKEQGETHGIKEGYMVDRIINIGYAKLLNNIQSLMESFCTADHGTVESYERKDNVVLPILSSKKNDKVEEWELKILQDTVCRFTEELYLKEDYVDPYVHLRPLVAKIIETFARNPSKKEAMVWGSFQLEENAFEIRYLPLAQPYQIKHLFKIFKKGDPLQHRLSWMEGSFAMTSPYMKKITLFVAKTGRKLRRHLGKTISRTTF